MKMTYIKIIMVSILPFLVSCSDDSNIETVEVKEYQPSKEGAQWVAKVGERYIENAELSHLLAFYHAKPGDVNKADIDGALEQLIEEEMYYQQAIEKGFDQHPEFKIRLRRLLASTYLQQSQRSRYQGINITDADINVFYQSNLKRYSSPAMYQTAVMKFEASVTDPKRQVAINVLKEKAEKLEASQGFADLALSSDHQRSRHKGGRLSWYTAGKAPYDIPMSVWQHVSQLKIGQVSQSIKDGQDSYLIRLIAIKEEVVQPLISVSNGIRQQLLQEKKHKVDLAIKQKLEKNTTIEINESALPSIKPAESISTPPSFPFG